MTHLLLALESCSNLAALSGSYCADQNVIMSIQQNFMGFYSFQIRLEYLILKTQLIIKTFAKLYAQFLQLVLAIFKKII
ncbi:unnamed protein product [Paramecium octaurelia]|uniref:Uncharacterized protein n=1 Tax=Paramecium octaurelia TaxID=43137 RepID=A0A8S1YN73_PAROT|nr:unnamed protein product [Paramecium octaurelia]